MRKKGEEGKDRESCAKKEGVTKKRDIIERGRNKKRERERVGEGQCCRFQLDAENVI